MTTCNRDEWFPKAKSMRVIRSGAGYGECRKKRGGTTISSCHWMCCLSAPPSLHVLQPLTSSARNSSRTSKDNALPDSHHHIKSMLMSYVDTKLYIPQSALWSQILQIHSPWLFMTHLPATKAGDPPLSESSTETQMGEEVGRGSFQATKLIGLYLLF